MITTPPRDIFWGCRPRGEGRFARAAGDGDLPTYIDRGIELIPRSEWRDDVGLDETIYHIFAQLDGMCTSNGTAQCLMSVRELQGQPRLILAPEDLYDHVGRWNTGSSLPDNIDVAARIGVRTRATVPREWPVRRQSGWEQEARQYRILEAVDLRGEFDAVVTALHLRYVCLIGVTWPGGGGHAVTCTRYLNGKLRGPNSWGRDWGDRGFYELTERQCSSMASYGAFAIRAVVEAEADPQPPQPIH